MPTHRAMMSPSIRLALVGLTILFCGSCNLTKDSSQQLSRVAKDWSLMMRASQVIPIFPMSEDVQVGDMFIVQTPIGEEVAQYESATGFLPFDNHVMRLTDLDFTKFYTNEIYNVKANAQPPKHFQFGPTTRPWIAAPQAAFPTFSFTIQRGGSATLALPVKGVPVGMGLLGAQEVQGQLTIADAYTYGLDRMALRARVKKWEGEPGVKEFLKTFAPYEETITRKGSFGRATRTERRLRVSFLRVVSRVYAANSVTVSLTTGEEFGGNVSLNNPLSTNLLGAATQPAQSYANMLTAINENLAKAATQPSDQSSIGSVKVASMSRRSVSMAETFPRPVVIGYVGFDYPILADGTLGEGISTRARLEQVVARSLDQRIADWLYSDRLENVVNQANAEKARSWLADKSPAERVDIPTLIYGIGYDDLRRQFVEELRVP